MPRESKWENVVCKNDIGTLTLYEGGSNSKCASENALWSVKFMGKTDGVVKVYPFVVPPEVYVSRKNNARKVKLLWKACYSDPHTVHQNELIVEFQDDVALDTFVKMIKLVPPAKSFHYENIGPSSTLIIDALVYDVSKSDRKVITYITPQLARDIFFQYPATLLAYKETVLATPQRLSDEDFWRFFCSSHYFTAMSRVNASLQSGSSKIVNTAHDELSPFLNEPRLLFEYFEDRYRKCSFEYGTNNSGLKSYYSFTAEKTIGFGTHLAQFLNRGDSTTIPESVEKISDLSSKIMNTSSLQSETICTTSSLADEPPEPKRMKLHPTSSRSENHRTVVFFYKARPHDLNNALQCLDTWISSPLLFNQDTFNTISNCYHFHGAGTPEQSLGALQRSDQTFLPLNAATNHFHLATRALTCCRDAWMHKNEEQDTQIDEILQHIQEHQDSGSEHSMLFPSLYSYLRRMLEKAKSKRQRLNIGMGWNEA